MSATAFTAFYLAQYRDAKTRLIAHAHTPEDFPALRTMCGVNTTQTTLTRFKEIPIEERTMDELVQFYEDGEDSFNLIPIEQTLGDILDKCMGREDLYICRGCLASIRKMAKERYKQKQRETQPLMEEGCYCPNIGAGAESYTAQRYRRKKMNNQVSGVVTVGINGDWSEYQRTGTLHLHFSDTRSLLCHGYYAQNEVLRRAAEIKSIPNITDLEQLSRLGDEYNPWRHTYHRLAKVLWDMTTGLEPDSTEIRPYKNICSNCVRALATHLKLYINQEEEKAGARETAWKREVNEWRRANGIIASPEENCKVKTLTTGDENPSVFIAFIMHEGMTKSDFNMLEPIERLDKDQKHDYEDITLEGLFMEMKRDYGDDQIYRLMEEERIKVFMIKNVPIKVKFMEKKTQVIDSIEEVL